MTILCICTYFKGLDFLRSAKEAGNTVLLLTHKKLEDKPWPREAVDEFYYLEDNDNTFSTYQTIIEGTAFLFQQRKIDLVVALDDFDVEKAALVREHFRIPGMGQTTARYFRDKLAMRMQAKDHDIPVPKFSALFNDHELQQYLEKIPGPWIIKPRSEASATGIKKVYTPEEVWSHVHSLGENRHNYLIESFKPGNVYHVDSLVYESKVIFERCSQYLSTPFDVAHGGGIFRSVTVEYGTLDQDALSLINHHVIRAFGLKFSAVHTEIIKCDDQYYFLETASRVGGAHLAEMVEYASGINLWTEWAKIETAVSEGKKYTLPKSYKKYSGILISLSSHKHPDMSVFSDPEIVWTMDEEYHVGMIIQSKSRKKVINLLDKYAKMVTDLGYHASAPAPDKPIH
jgi:biotin carboxylase